jgi:fused signal recognition particle receptor
MGLFSKLVQGLKKTKQILQTDVRDLFKSGEIFNEEHLKKFEKRFIETDMGVDAAGQIVEELRIHHFGRTVKIEDIWQTVKDKLKGLLKGDEQARYDVTKPLSPLKLATTGPSVILVSGVNGVGKTTSIAKLANLLKSQEKKVLLAAGDTFRAAAVEQLTLWSQRLGCEIVTKPSGTDPAAVAFAGCEAGLASGVDCIIIDTAGRLHTQQNLMQELDKVYRVIGKKIPGAPHESLLVLDATTGQNGLSQAQSFSEIVKSTGLILAKLDGTAKGGIAVAIRQKMGIPVKYIGVGEQIDDLEVFEPDQFVDALFAE